MLTEKIEHAKKDFATEISNIENSSALDKIRIKFLGRNGIISELFDRLKAVDEKDKPVIGKNLNLLRSEITSRINEAISSFNKEEKGETLSLDLTLPSKKYKIGSRHILTQTHDEIT